MSWNTEQLNELFNNKEGYDARAEGDALVITDEDGLEAILSIAGSQMVVESILFPASQVNDATALNELILKTHKLFPLTTLCINTIGGEDYYTAFGALSSASIKASVLLEVDSLFMNVQHMLDAYAEYLQQS